MKNKDIKLHVQGKSQYVDDIPAREGLLHAVIFGSPVAKGIIKSLDISNAEAYEDVVKVLTFKDIPGKNQVGHITQDQELLAEKQVSFIGQPIALVIGRSRKKAFEALKHIFIDIEEEQPIVDPREAYKKDEIIGQLHLKKGSVEDMWSKCSYVFEGRVESGGQEHFYLETQASLAEPQENGNIKVYCNAQAPGGYQHHVSDVLGIPMHKVEIEIRRLGGAFGGKEGCAAWTCLAAVAAFQLKIPVKLVLSRKEDIATTGKRHPFSYDYKIGFNEDGKILAYEVKMFQNAGAFADISMPVLNRAILHTVSSYGIPHFKGSAYSCRTNITPNTAFRGFGVPQAVFLIESAIFDAAIKMRVPPVELQKKNLIDEGYVFPYGMKVENCNLKKCWDTLDEKNHINQRINAVRKYNRNNKATKKGIYVMPVCFGISFVQTFLNQAGALVHIYTDGSVGISTGAVEMGQGVNMKILLVAAKVLSINPDRIKIEPTNSTRVANASPTSASTGADLNGMATHKACMVIIERLKKFAAEKFNEDNWENIEILAEKIYINDRDMNYNWNQLVSDAYFSRIDLSEHAFFAPPRLSWNSETMSGSPFTYHSFGTSITEVTLDTVRGTYKIDSIKIVHDIGKTISESVDRGQFEGGVVQGMGWASIENLQYSENGKCLSTTSAYKIPDIKFVPDEFELKFLENVKNPYAVCNSKAVGEPPFIHGIATYFALLDACVAANPDKMPSFSLPMTPEKAFMYIHDTNA